MKSILITIGLMLVSSQALAIERYTSTSMSCGEVQQTIRRDGAAIMRYNSARMPNLPLFGRYVRNAQFCKMGEAAVQTYIRASDTSSCPVLECQVVDFDDPMRIFPQR